MRRERDRIGRRPRSLILVAGVLLFWPAEAAGRLSPSAREWALGGAYTAVGRGVEAQWTNPANLALPDGPRLSVSLLSLSTGVGNNSFSLQQYNRYSSGITLGEEDKQDILDAVPESGFEVRADVGANALGFSLGRVSFAANTRLSASMGVSRDFFDLLFRGNEIGRHYSLGGTTGEAFAVLEVGAAYAHPFRPSWAEHVSVGIGVKHLLGLGYAEVVESSGDLVTTPGEASGTGRVVVRYAGETRTYGDDEEEFEAVRGHGWAFDVGMALGVGDGWTVSAVLKDISTGISWPAVTERGFEFTADSLSADTADDDDLVTSDDYVVSKGKVHSSYPGAFRLGVMRERGRLLLTADYEQGLGDFAGRLATPRLSAGAEYRPLTWLPLRLGVALGGRERANLAWGGGLDLGPLALDLALRQWGMTPGGSKGLSFAFASRLDF